MSSGQPGLCSGRDRSGVDYVEHLKCSGFESSFTCKENCQRRPLIRLSLCCSSQLM